MDHISTMERISGLKTDLTELNDHLAAPGVKPSKRHLAIMDALHGLPDMVNKALAHFPHGHVLAGARVFDPTTGFEVAAGTAGAVTEPNLKPGLKAVPYGIGGHVAAPVAPAPGAVAPGIHFGTHPSVGEVESGRYIPPTGVVEPMPANAGLVEHKK